MNKEIKAIITDIDGVIVGSKSGVNLPFPHPDVMERLKVVRENGVMISLCTAKPQFSMRDIAEEAGLDNPHIADSGGVIINPVTDEIISVTSIDNELALAVVSMFLEQGVYTEVHTPTGYYIQKSQECEYTPIHAEVLQGAPVMVSSLLDEIKDQSVTKIMPVVADESCKWQLDAFQQAFGEKLSFAWGIHPVALPLQFGIITAPGVSKKQGAQNVSDAIGVSFENTLGIGDGLGDWAFMEQCKYVATLENAPEELKEKVRSKGEGRFFIGSSVDDNGMLDILDYFDL